VRVGKWHGNPVVLRVQAKAIHGAGVPFYHSANGVWLVAHVLPITLSFPIRAGCVFSTLPPLLSRIGTIPNPTSPLNNPSLMAQLSFG
jgi:hypothetical protein